MASPGYRLAAGAVGDVEQISEYIGHHNLFAADRVIETIFQTLDAIAINPEMGTNLDELRPGLRMFIPPRPAANYVIFYYCDTSRITITAVLHSARDWLGMFLRGER
jgi:toxin ParE1/3/4